MGDGVSPPFILITFAFHEDGRTQEIRLDRPQVRGAPDYRSLKPRPMNHQPAPP